MPPNPPNSPSSDHAEILANLDALTIIQIRNRTDGSRPENERIKAVSGMENGAPVGYLIDGHGRVFLKATDFATEAEAKAHMEKVIEACKA